MRVTVVGAGAWGLPAAAELARRGHAVDLIDGFGVGNAVGSSAGSTRIWRLTHPDPLATRLALRSVDAWRRLEARTDVTILLRRGLLWRGDEAPAIADVLTAESIDSTLVDPADVGRFFPGLKPDDQPAVWQEDAGPLLSERALAAELEVLLSHGGRTHFGCWVDDVDPREAGVRVRLRPDPPGDDVRTIDSDVVVLAPGPFARPLLASIGVEVDLRPRLQQVAYFGGDADWETWPCLISGPSDPIHGVYAMPTPGLGYKLGLEAITREFRVDDMDRTASDDLVRVLESYVARSLPSLTPSAVATQVCSWTDSADGRFIIDRVHGGRVVVACGDSGQGFKFSALMGEVLADLAEGADADPDVASLGLDRFGASPDGAGHAGV